MANNYLQFSVTLSEISEEELVWINLLCERVNNLATGDDIEDVPYDVVEAAERVSVTFGEGTIDFQALSMESPLSIWFVSKESNDPAVVGAVVHEFFRRWRPKGKDIFVLQWCDYCDKLRENEFGGGAIIVTAKKVYSMTTGEWVDQQLKVLTKKPKQKGHALSRLSVRKKRGR